MGREVKVEVDDWPACDVCNSSRIMIG